MMLVEFVGIIFCVLMIIAWAYFIVTTFIESRKIGFIPRGFYQPLPSNTSMSKVKPPKQYDDDILKWSELYHSFQEAELMAARERRRRKLVRRLKKINTGSYHRL